MARDRNMFVQLHNHSRYSLSDGLHSPQYIIDGIKEKGMKSIAISDHYILNEIPYTLKYAKEKGIKVIPAVEFGVVPEGISEGMLKITSDDDKDAKKADTEIPYFHLTVLAKNSKGYHNLIKLSSIANRKDGHFYRKPRIKFEDLEQYHEGLIVLDGCLAGETSQHILHNTGKEEQIIKQYHNLFKDDYYLELQDHGIKEQKITLKRKLELSEKLNIKTVLTNDSHYMNKEDGFSHKLLQAINFNQSIHDESKYFDGDNYEFYYKSPKEMYKVAVKNNCLDAFYNTQEIDEKCEIIEIDRSLKHPPVKGLTKDPIEALKDKVNENITYRYPEYNTDPELKKKIDDRIAEEIETIDILSEVRTAEYFLNVSKITDYCRNNGILTGISRGSCGGSIISYIIGITGICPLEYGLIFSRFLNRGRTDSPADIDLDISSNRRDEVIEFCKKEWGEDNVCSMGTHGTLSGRGLVTSGCKALDNGNQEYIELGKKINDLISTKTSIKLSVALKEPELNKLYNTNKKVKETIDILLKLEGCKKNKSSHAAALLISDRPVTEFTPIYIGRNGWTTEYTYECCESIGGLKVDLLGHASEMIEQDTFNFIKERHGIEINQTNIPLDDTKTFEMIRTLDTTAIPQLEPAWQKDIISDIAPDNINHIIDIIALVRPGSLNSGDTQRYRDVRQGAKINYAIPQLKEITHKTNGCVLFQEQVFRMVTDLAGMTLLDADNLRKVVAKTKYKHLAEPIMEKFKEGCLNGLGIHGKLTIDEWQKADKVIRSAFDYGFNLSHSAGYGIGAYHCAWLKANYFIEYMTSVLNSKLGKKDLITPVVKNIREHGVKISPPDINISDYRWAINDRDEIVMPLSGIDGVGQTAIETIMDIRDQTKNGFISFEDFIEKTPSTPTNIKVINNLVKSGCFDRMNSRKSLLKAIESGIVDSIRKNANKKTLFSIMPKIEVKLNDELSITQLKEYENELLGFAVTLTDQEIKRMTKNFTPITQRLSQSNPFNKQQGKPNFKKEYNKQNNVNPVKVSPEDEKIKSLCLKQKDSIIKPIGSDEMDNINDIKNSIKTSIKPTIKKEQQINTIPNEIYLDINTNTNLTRLYANLKQQQDDNGKTIIFNYTSEDGNKYFIKTKYKIN